MNALTRIENTAIAAMSETELVSVLQSSLYPGAKLESIKMVLGYCKAAGLDPMKKPVHIVPMKVSTGQKDERGWDIKETRDVIMPGVGMYRTEASRTGQYAGVTEPEFGPIQQLDYTVDVWEDDNGRRKKTTKQKTLRYPEWCRVSVDRIVDGSPRTFTAKEFWLENYATRGSDGAPNEMWTKRPFAQLAKCAEAQALRKAFPDTTGAQPTAEEMQDHPYDEEPRAPRDVTPLPPTPTFYPEADFAKNLPAWLEVIKKGRKTADQIIALAETKHPLSEEQKAKVRAGDKKAPIDATPAATPAPSSAPVVTYADIADKLEKAANKDDLAVAGDLIGSIADAQQRAELQAIYDRREQELA
jgi:phage recombination protein Bet